MNAGDSSLGASILAYLVGNNDKSCFKSGGGARTENQGGDVNEELQSYTQSW